MWKSYLIAYPQSGDEFWSLTPKLYVMKIDAFMERRNQDFNDQIDIALAGGVFANPPKNLDVNTFYRGKRSDPHEGKSEQQKNNELIVALANFSDRFRKPASE